MTTTGPHTGPFFWAPHRAEGAINNADDVKAAAECLKALPGQDAEALAVLLAYAREQHTAAKDARKLLADARAFALLQHCFCESGRKRERCRLLAALRDISA